MEYISHSGIKGMKWGVRRYQNKDGSLTPAGQKRYSAATRIARGHAGPGMYVGKKRQLEGFNRDLEFLNKGGHLSYGLTKKRQAAYDKRDREALEKKITKLEAKEASKANKREAKAEYKKAKASAAEEYSTAKKNADSQYEKDMAKKNAALDKVKKTYDIKDAETDRYYKGEIEKHQRKADEAKADMDFWEDPDSGFYREAASRYVDANRSIRDLEVRRDSVVMANKIARDNATVKVNEMFYDSSEKAINKRQASYAKAGEDYWNSLTTAKKVYKEAKKK